MAPLRTVDPTGLYHVITRGNFRQPIFLDEDHYAKHIRLLTRVQRRREWTILDWCLMPNHFHLLIQLTNGGLSEGMRELNGCFSRWSNLRTGRTGTGHFLKNRFRSLDVIKEGHFWRLVQYIPANPVAADRVAAPDDWPWSGYRATTGLEHPYAFHQPAELLRYFAAKPETAVARYRRFVHDGLVNTGLGLWSDQDDLPATLTLRG